MLNHLTLIALQVVLYMISSSLKALTNSKLNIISALLCCNTILFTFVSAVIDT